MDKKTLIETGKILIVSEDRKFSFSIEKMLKKGGYLQIQSASSALEAESVFLSFRPDLILLDFFKRAIDSFPVMDRFKNLEKEGYLSLIAFSSNPTKEVRLKTLEKGARDFIEKKSALDPLEVLSRVSNALEVRLLHNQIRDQNKLLAEKVKLSVKDLHETHLAIIQRLVRAVEYRDNDTGLHIIRIGKFCEALAGRLGWDDEQCNLIQKSSPMHDIGKICIPDGILLKPGKLTKEEWEIMKTHAAIGAELLSGSHVPLLQMASLIAHTHHERWNGEGYPRGLKGDAIPLEGRICSVCDVFDALISERPYKKAWPVEEAVAEIERCRGTQFDPLLVDHFKKLVPRFMEIKQQAVHWLARSELPSFYSHIINRSTDVL